MQNKCTGCAAGCIFPTASNNPTEHRLAALVYASVLACLFVLLVFLDRAGVSHILSLCVIGLSLVMPGLLIELSKNVKLKGLKY